MQIPSFSYDFTYFLCTSKFCNYHSFPSNFFLGNNDPNSCRTFSRTPTFAVRINSHPKYNNAFDLADVLQNGKQSEFKPILDCFTASNDSKLIVYLNWKCLFIEIKWHFQITIL